jgi:hypothetical protein
MALGNKFSRENSLVKLISNIEKLHVGYIIRMQYDSVDVLSNDFFKEEAGGVPQNSFLLATAFDPNNFQNARDIDKVVLLLRVQGSCKLPQDDMNLNTIIEHFQSLEDIVPKNERDGIEEITHSILQFGGLSCAILGCFYSDEQGRLRLGADIEDFQSVAHLRVYKPSNEALSTIVNYIDPIKKSNIQESATKMGFPSMPEPFKIGTVRYTSTNRMQKREKTNEVIVEIQPTDFLSRRTAVLGMTRTGKSNTIKTTVSAVAVASIKSNVKIGQLIFDLNGEYANATGQDDGSSIAEVFEDNVVRYRGLPTEGFEDLRDNFYQSLTAGLNILQSVLGEDSLNGGQDMQNLLNMSLDEPDDADKFSSEYARWELQSALYKTLLYKSGFEYEEKDNFIKFKVGKQVFRQMYDTLILDEEKPETKIKVDERIEKAKEEFGNPNEGINFEQATEFFGYIRTANRKIRKEEGDLPKGLLSSSGKSWLSDVDRSLLNLLVGKSENDTFIRSTGVIGKVKVYHSKEGSDNIPRDVYNHLKDGKIVILDLSVGDQKVKERISKQIATYLLAHASENVNQGNRPMQVVAYIEEAHNLIGKKAELTEIWPRIAKEGAKFGIALVYATQEPSSVHPNIMANTENFFITHLNNDDELRALAKYYDFGDFSASLKKAQDVGFARIKTLSSPYVVPTQILKFEPQKLKEIIGRR